MKRSITLLAAAVLVGATGLAFAQDLKGAYAYGDDKVDLAIGPTSSASALAMLPVAEEYKKLLLVEPAVADSITGDKWNRYIFRTGRSSSQDAIAAAVATPQNAQIAM